MSWVKRGALALAAVGSVWSAVALASSGTDPDLPDPPAPDPVCVDWCYSRFLLCGSDPRCEDRYFACVDQCPQI